MFADQKPAIIILFKMIRSNNYSSSILPKWMMRQRATAWMIVTLLLSRRFTATESWAVQLSGLREAV